MCFFPGCWWSGRWVLRWRRTVTWEGYSALETVSGPDVSLQLLVADRFFVEVEGTDVTLDTVKAAMAEIDLAKLAEMR